jgi:hypothetical protein
LSGNGGVFDLIVERYTIGEAEELGHFRELETFTLRESGE